MRIKKLARSRGAEVTTLLLSENSSPTGAAERGIEPTTPNNQKYAAQNASDGDTSVLHPNNKKSKSVPNRRLLSQIFTFKGHFIHRFYVKLDLLSKFDVSESKKTIVFQIKLKLSKSVGTFLSKENLV